MNSSDDRAPLAQPAARPDLLGLGLVLSAATLFSVNGTVSKIVLQAGVGSLRLVELRCAAAAVGFFVIVLLRAPRTARIGLREGAVVSVYGILGVAMVQWLYFVAIVRMPVSVALLLEFTAPLMVALWVRFVRRRPVRRRIWAAIVLVLGGLALVARVWDGLTLDGIGLLAASLAAVSLAGYYLLGESALGTRDPVSLAAWSFTAATAFWSVVQPWTSFPWHLFAPTVAVGHTGLHAPVWALMVWVVLLGTVAPFLLVLGGLRRVGATRVGLVGTVEPVFAGGVAWLVMGESLLPIQLAGAVVVLAGIVLAETARTEGGDTGPAREFADTVTA